MFISHLHCPDFRVWSDFRKENYEYFKACFKQSVLLAMEAGMTSFGHVSLDGSKFKANTSRHKAMSYGRLQEREKALTEEIEALVKKAEQCDRARIMGKKGDFQYAYNGQITVDKDHQIILGQHITQKANDKQEVKPALQEIKDTTGKLPDRMSLDNYQAQSGDCHGCSCRDMCCKSKDGSGRTITTDDKEPLRLGEFSDSLLA